MRKTSSIKIFGRQLLLFAFLISVNLFAQDEIDCLDCHDNLPTQSVHYDMVDCQECHTDIISEDHEDQKVKKVNCLDCHDEYAQSVKLDIHHRLTEKVKNPPSCKTCHGTHKIYAPEKVKDIRKTYCSQCHKVGHMKYFYAYHSPKIPNSECLDCHEDEDTHYLEILKNSKHNRLNCADCHNYIAHNLEEHQDTLSVSHRADCFVCHNDVNIIYSKSVHGIALMEGVDEAAKCWNCHNSHNIVSVDNEKSPVNPRNIAGTCGKCHDDPSYLEKFNFPMSSPEKKYNLSVHGKVVGEGKKGATCVSCHGGHSISNLNLPTSSINSINIPKTCGQCHEKESNAYKNSIHWNWVQKGFRFAPVCNDCHTEHSISMLKLDESDMADFQQATCIDCHQSQVLIRRTGMDGTEVSEYLDSYHGLATKKGDTQAAHCVDCHSVHSILPGSHPESSVNKANIVNTCRKCHKDANKTFALSYTHKSASSSAKATENIVRIIYTWLIILVIGAMVLHNLLIFLRELANKKRNEKDKFSIPRFNQNERIQHILLLSTFIVLAITGFALKYPDAFWAKFLNNLGMEEEIRQIIHRIMAVIMVLTGIWHIIYLFITRRGRFQLVQLLPSLKDIKDFFANMLYYLNLSKKRPEFSYYDYAEKAEYWALIWGTLVMGLTGFILWFPTLIDQWAPVWLIKISEIIHFYEAILASLAIIVWHWFFVIYRPSEYPMNFTWIRGDTPLDQFKHHHLDHYKNSIVELNAINNDQMDQKDASYFSKLILERLKKDQIKLEEFLLVEMSKDDQIRKLVKK